MHRSRRPFSLIHLLDLGLALRRHRLCHFPLTLVGSIGVSCGSLVFVFAFKGAYVFVVVTLLFVFVLR